MMGLRSGRGTAALAAFMWLAMMAGARAADEATPTRSGGPDAGSAAAGVAAARNDAAGRHVAPLVSTVALIERVDQRERRLRFRDPEGKRLSVRVPAQVQGFASLAPGDQIEVSYYQPVALAFVPGAAEPPAASPPRRISVGGGLMAEEITAPLTVAGVDAKKGTLSGRAPDGTSAVLKVDDAELLQVLAGLRAGDVVRASYTEAVATNLSPHVTR
jgi:hypothetical protein